MVENLFKIPIMNEKASKKIECFYRIQHKMRAFIGTIWLIRGRTTWQLYIIIVMAGGVAVKGNV
jgi:hypothetical protein